MSLPMRYAVNLETGCWEWAGELSSNGYGRVWRDGERIAAHRAYYEQEVGPIPDGHLLDHTCRVRCCVNPAHLEPVIPAENIRRAVPHKRIGGCLSHQAVKVIRASKKTNAALAQQFGVAASTISEARRGITWNDEHSYLERRELLKAAA